MSTTLSWDDPGTRFFETGVDRGVLYLPEGNGVAWNGLISVSEKVTGLEGSPLYYDGVKYADVQALGDFSATLRAYTYPDEFLEFEGILEVGNGLYVANQQPRRFGLSYRTLIGSDEDGMENGYKIHVVYNLTAIPSAKTFDSLSGTSSAMAFEWLINGLPGEIPGFRATAHLIFDSRKMSGFLLQDLEESLYGDGVSEPTLPSISSLVSFIDSWVIIRITDNGDGTWTAEGPDEFITMLDATTFQIISASAVYIDGDTYMISSLTY